MNDCFNSEPKFSYKSGYYKAWILSLAIHSVVISSMTINSNVFTLHSFNLYSRNRTFLGKGMNLYLLNQFINSQKIMLKIHFDI